MGKMNKRHSALYIQKAGLILRSAEDISIGILVQQCIQIITGNQFLMNNINTYIDVMKETEHIISMTDIDTFIIHPHLR